MSNETFLRLITLKVCQIEFALFSLISNFFLPIFRLNNDYFYNKIPFQIDKLVYMKNHKESSQLQNFSSQFSPWRHFPIVCIEKMFFNKKIVLLADFPSEWKNKKEEEEKNTNKLKV